jgi:hypothetical protein
MDWPEITAFCLELRLSFLKSKDSAAADNDLIKKIFEDIVATKERKWESKMRLMANIWKYGRRNSILI